MNCFFFSFLLTNWKKPSSPEHFTPQDTLPLLAQPLQPCDMLSLRTAGTNGFVFTTQAQTEKHVCRSFTGSVITRYKGHIRAWSHGHNANPLQRSEHSSAHSRPAVSYKATESLLSEIYSLIITVNQQIHFIVH